MIMIHLLSQDLKNAYEEGKRVFEDTNFEYAQMEDWNLDNITFRDCKFNFTSFRFTSLKNARFVGCDFFFHSFFSADLENAVFDNCKIEGSRMDAARFDRTVFRKCSLSYVLMIDTNRGGVDLTSSTLFGMIFSLSDITEDFVKGALGFFMPAVDNLDFEIRSHVKSVINKYASEIGMNAPNVETANNTYQRPNDTYNRSPAVYGAVSGIFGDIINAYTNMNKARKDAYGKKNNYER